MWFWIGSRLTRAAGQEGGALSPGCRHTPRPAPPRGERFFAIVHFDRDRRVAHHGIEGVTNGCAEIDDRFGRPDVLPQRRRPGAAQAGFGFGTHFHAEARALVLVDTRLEELIAPELSAYVGPPRPGGNSRSPCCRSPGLDDCSAAAKSAGRSRVGTRPVRSRRHRLRGQREAPFVLHAPGRHAFARLWPDITKTSRWRRRGKLQPGPSQARRRSLRRVQDPGARLRPDGPRRGRRPGALGGLPPRRLSETTPRTPTRTGPNNCAVLPEAPPPSTAAAAYGRGCTWSPTTSACPARAKPVWDAVGPKEIEFYSINEKGKDAYKNNPAGYIRVDLEKYPSLEAFLDYAGKTPSGWTRAGNPPRDLSQPHEPVAAAVRLVERPFQPWNIADHHAAGEGHDRRRPDRRC